MENKIIWWVGVAVIVGAVFMAGELGLQFFKLPQNAPHEVQVTGEGKAYAKPDVAEVSLGVHTQANTSQDAVNQNNQAMNKVIGAVKNLGVADNDIQTTQYNLSPVYDYTDKGRVFKGYTLDQSVQVKIRDFSKISGILDAASAAGANTIGDLQFTVDDMEKVRAQAREQAIAQAKEKATSMFQAAGLSAGSIVNISENYNNPSPQPVAYGMGAGPMASSIAPQIQTGQNEVDDTVTLTYQVK